MKTRKSSTIIFSSLVALVVLSGCANTIRGVGSDTANTVNATQDAVKKTGNAIAN